MASGYNGNGRPVVEIYGGGSSFTLHTPDGIRRDLNREAAVGVLTSYPVRPALKFDENVSGSAKTFFRGKITAMLLP